MSDRSGSIVRGVRLSHSVRDRLRVSIDKLAIQYISPAVPPMIITTNLHTVLEPKTKQVSADLRVVGKCVCLIMFSLIIHLLSRTILINPSMLNLYVRIYWWGRAGHPNVSWEW